MIRLRLSQADMRPDPPFRASAADRLAAEPARGVGRNSPPAGSEPAGKRWRRVAWIALPAVVLAWLAWPYVTAYRLATAVQEADARTMERLVDWAALRSQVRGLISGAVAAEAVRDGPGSSGSALGMAFASAIIGPMVDGMVTPDAVAAMVRGERARATGTAPRAAAPTFAPELGSRVTRDVRWEFIRWAGPTGLTTFEVVLGEKDGPVREPVTALFEFRDLGWKLTRIEVPLPPPRAR